MKSEKLKEKYEQARRNVESRYPGSVVAGPARYPVAKHNQAWDHIMRLAQDYAHEIDREVSAERHKATMAAKAAETNKALRDNPIASIQHGQLVRVHWTNSNSSYSAIAKVVKINARTITHELVDQIPDGWEAGQRWATPKIGTPGNRIEVFANA